MEYQWIKNPGRGNKNNARGRFHQRILERYRFFAITALAPQNQKTEQRHQIFPGKPMPALRTIRPPAGRAFIGIGAPDDAI